jgi:hypothetical protein
VFYGIYVHWWGDWGWGPRYFVPMTPFLILPLLPLLQRWRQLPRAARRTIYALAAAGVVVQLLDINLDFSHQLQLLVESGVQPPDAQAWTVQDSGIWRHGGSLLGLLSGSAAYPTTYQLTDLATAMPLKTVPDVWWVYAWINGVNPLVIITVIAGAVAGVARLALWLRSTVVTGVPPSPPPHAAARRGDGGRCPWWRGRWPWQRGPSPPRPAKGKRSPRPPPVNAQSRSQAMMERLGAGARQFASRASPLVARTTKRVSAIPSWVFVAVVPGFVALGLCAYQLAQPNALIGLHGSDDGVYLGPAIQLLHGALPYRDYAWVHPPGIALLMAPLGFLGDTREAMAATRVVTALVIGANAALAAIALRSRGRIAMLVGGLGLAMFPQTASIGHSLSLDAYLVLFCLLGTIVMFRNGGLASRRRLLLAGVLFGFAIATKSWGIFPSVAGLLICVPLWRSAVVPFGSGLLIGVGLPSLPFFFAAPGAFLHDVVFSQLTRSITGQGYTSFGERLQLLLGFTPSLDPTPNNVAVVIAGILAVLIVATFWISAHKFKRFDWFVLAAAVIAVGAMMFVVKEIYSYYAYFVAAFGVMLLGICVSRVADGIHWVGERMGGFAQRASGPVATAGIPAVVVIAAVLLLPGNVTHAATFVSGAYDPQATVVSQIPAGACVVYDEAGILLDSNRFPAAQSGCPDIVDAFGLWLIDNDGIPPPAQAESDAFVAKWFSWLEEADYVALSVPQSDYLPWTPNMTSWFNSNYHLVASQPNVYIYKHT